MFYYHESVTKGDFDYRSYNFVKLANVNLVLFVSLRFVDFEKSLLTPLLNFGFELSPFRFVVLESSLKDRVVLVTSSSKSLKNPRSSRLSRFGRFWRSKLTTFTVGGCSRSVVFVSTFDAKSFRLPSRVLKRNRNENLWKK